jgi:hypothetical protein
MTGEYLPDIVIVDVGFWGFFEKDGVGDFRGGSPSLVRVVLTGTNLMADAPATGHRCVIRLAELSGMRIRRGVLRDVLELYKVGFPIARLSARRARLVEIQSLIAARGPGQGGGPWR